MVEDRTYRRVHYPELGGRALARLYTDALWFEALGYGRVFWTRLAIGAAARLAAGALAGGLVLGNLALLARQLGPVQLRRRYGNLEIAEQIPRRYVVAGIAGLSALAGIWLSGVAFGGEAALQVAAWVRHRAWGAADPLLGRDLAFYVFALPVFFRAADTLLVALLWAALLVLLGYVVLGAVRWRAGRLVVEDAARVHLTGLLAALVALVALRYWLARYGLLLGGSGFRDALGYTDAAARLPAYGAMALLALLAAAALVYSAWQRNWAPALAALGGLLAAGILAGYAIPSVVQKLRVEPNELAKERPSIAWHLAFTRHAFALDRVERRRFPYRPHPLPPWEELAPRLAPLGLWDPDPLRVAYNQTQSLFGYYHFPDVDDDRYGPPGDAQHVAIAAREFRADGLSPSARTWQSLRLNPEYMRGVGVVVTPAAETGSRGGPAYWVDNLDPIRRDPAAPPELELRRPEIYFGESMRDYVILGPGRNDGADGGPARDGPVGIRLGPLPRLFAFAWRFADRNLLFSGEVTGDSRIVFRRQVVERLRALAPFLLWDPDIHPVVHGGRVVWLADGYTAAESFPLARPVELAGRTVRYLRNSVKATVDAVTGAVALFATDPHDPVLAAYRRVFPDLFQPLDVLDPELRRHLRYPRLFFLVQARLLQEYHLERPEAFYAQEDLWQLPEDPDGSGDAAAGPVYALLRLPGQPAPEFVLQIGQDAPQLGHGPGRRLPPQAPRHVDVAQVPASAQERVQAEDLLLDDGHLGLAGHQARGRGHEGDVAGVIIHALQFGEDDPPVARPGRRLHARQPLQDLAAGQAVGKGRSAAQPLGDEHQVPGRPPLGQLLQTPVLVKQPRHAVQDFFPGGVDQKVPGLHHVPAHRAEGVLLHSLAGHPEYGKLPVTPRQDGLARVVPPQRVRLRRPVLVAHQGRGVGVPVGHEAEQVPVFPLVPGRGRHHGRDRVVAHLARRQQGDQGNPPGLPCRPEGVHQPVARSLRVLQGHHVGQAGFQPGRELPARHGQGLRRHAHVEFARCGGAHFPHRRAEDLPQPGWPPFPSQGITEELHSLSPPCSRTGQDVQFQDSHACP